MKRIINIIALAVLAVAIASCEKDTEGISFETNYATFEMSGDNPLLVPQGTAYNEPGLVAIAGEEELEVESTTDLDVNSVGVYTVHYAAVNKDGYPASTSRTVLVYNPEAPDTDFSGEYTADVVRTEADDSDPRPRGGFTVEITKIARGIFYVDDLLGGYYAQGSGYGAAYAMTGYVSLNPDNTLTLLSSHVTGWGDGLENYYDASYSPLLGTFTWKSVYAGSDIFTVNLK